MGVSLAADRLEPVHILGDKIKLLQDFPHWENFYCGYTLPVYQIKRLKILHSPTYSLLFSQKRAAQPGHKNIPSNSCKTFKLINILAMALYSLTGFASGFNRLHSMHLLPAFVRWLVLFCDSLWLAIMNRLIPGLYSLYLFTVLTSV